MKFYAQLNENNVCTGISQLNDEVNSPSMVEITQLDTDFLWCKFEDGAWSTIKHEPQSTAPITEFQSLKLWVELIQETLDELILGGTI